MNADALIIHLSDLHFSGYLQNVDNIGEWSQVAKTHDFLVLQEMESIIVQLLREYRDRVIVVITGDLTTAAEPPAYELLTTYLFGKVWISENKRVGLGLHDEFHLQDRVFVVPGNHDAWLRFSGILRRLTRWRQHFDRRQLFRDYFGMQPQVKPLVVNGVSFVFYLLDSNELVAGGLNAWNIRNALGRGRVGRAQIGNVLAMHNQLMAGNIPVPPGFELDAAIRIGVLHHHPAIPDDLPSGVEQRLLRLQDAPDVTALFHEQLHTHLVVCGHQHFPYLYPDPATAAPWLSCAGTATQHKSPVNSFKLYWIRKSAPRSITVEEFVRNRAEAAVSKFTSTSTVPIPLL
ncbi:MAG: metallophosphoesterase [Acidobacteriota bacterium]